MRLFPCTPIFASLSVIFVIAANAPVRAFFSGDLSAEDYKHAGFTHLTIQDGLSQNSVYGIAQDHLGFIYFATQDGLNRFDGYQFKVYRRNPASPEKGLSENNLRPILCDDRNRLWIGTFGGGLNMYDPSTGRFTHFSHDPQNPRSICADFINQIYQASDGTIWIAGRNGMSRYVESTNDFHTVQYDGTNHGLPHPEVTALCEGPRGGLWVATRDGLARFHPDSIQFNTYKHDPERAETIPSNQVTALTTDPRGRLWVGTINGLAVYDPTLDQFRTYSHRPDRPESLADNSVSCLMVDSRDLLWVGTDGGLSLYDHENDRFHNFTNRQNQNKSLRENLVLSLFEDRTGMIWIGTDGGGIARINPWSLVFKHFEHKPDQDTISRNAVLTFFEDEKAQIWIGTDGGGLNLFNPKKETFQVFRHDPDNLSSLPGDRIWNIAGDRDGTMWLATWSGLAAFDPTTGKSRNYLADPSREDALPGNKLMAVWVDRKSEVWAATLNNGLARMVAREDRFVIYQAEPGIEGSLSHNWLLTLFQDSNGRMWIGTYGGGLNLYEPATDRFTVFKADPERPNSISHNSIMHIFEDAAGNLWLGTVGGGLNKFQPSEGRVKHYSREDGLPNDTVYAVREDESGYLWISTNLGLSRMDPRNETFRNFDLSHNLQGTEFNQGAALRASDGALYFGGMLGFNQFYPEKVGTNRNLPQAVITDIRIFNQPLESDIPYQNLTDLNLGHQDDVIAFEVAAMDFTAPTRNQFSYQLEGFHDHWIDLGTKRDIIFTNLDPGHYQLRVRAANSDGIWNETPSTLDIRITPPPWRSIWAYLLYIVVAGSIFGAVIRYQRKRWLQTQRINEKLLRLDKLKDEFLANTSQELKTPLNGLIGIAESLLNGAAGPIRENMKDNLVLMVSSGKRLEALINDILDFSKAKNQALDLNIRSVDLFTLVDVVITLLRPLADQKSLIIENQIPLNFPQLRADENRLQQILYNLLDNAIKFTNYGRIKLTAVLEGKDAKIAIIDTGVGIAPDRMGEIWLSFEQLSSAEPFKKSGSGLGLTITRRLVELHQGRIGADSVPGKGSRFWFTIPLAGEQTIAQDIPSTSQKTTEIAELEAGEETTAKDAPHILIVDDEAINQQVLVNVLSLAGYRFTTVSNGEEALKSVFSGKRFDLILLDIMMPKISGFEVCRKIRERFGSHELPIIFLTAKNQGGDLTTGFDLGANDFLQKPFAKDELLARVRTQLELVGFTRALEQMVIQRTNELEARNQELEKMDEMVHQINQKLDPQEVLTTILEQCAALFPRAQIGSFLLRDKTPGLFKFITALGFDVNLLEKRFLSGEEIQEIYVNRADRLEKGFYRAHHFSLPDSVIIPDRVLNPKSFFAMSIHIDDVLEGFLILSNHQDGEAFEETDVKRLKRFREHAVTALARAKVINELADTQRDLVAAAHTMGMAENATNVLHHMGNHLNSVNTSVQVLQEIVSRDRWVALSDRLVGLLKEQKDLADFFESSKIGKTFPDTLDRFFRNMKRWHGELKQESQRLETHIHGVLSELREQQEYTDLSDLSEMIDLSQLLDGCVQMELQAYEKENIQVVKDYGRVPQITAQRLKLMRAVIFILQNARESYSEMPPDHDARITLTTKAEDNRVIVRITDNGSGISPEDISKVFTQGFSTKKNMKGLGLHNAANSIKEMGGNIEIESSGRHQGTTVTIWFSY